MRWMDVGKSVRSVAVLSGTAAVLAGLMLAACGNVRLTNEAAARPVPGRPVPASAIPQLTAIAARAVKANGGAAPAWVSAVVTTYAKALTSATPGDIVTGAGSTPVYLVTMKGHFVAYSASVPPGGHAPTGEYLSIVVDAKTFRASDSGLGPKPPPVDPASLGPVTYLRMPNSATRSTPAPPVQGSPVPLPGPLPSSALCRDMPHLRSVTVIRLNTLPHNHFRFAFPATVQVTNREGVQAVARTLCALPPDTIVNCPMDFGVGYRLTFHPARLRLTPVEVDTTGCGMVTGLGVPHRAVTTQFWRILGSAMGLAGSPATAARLLQGTLPWIAGR